MKNYIFLTIVFIVISCSYSNEKYSNVSFKERGLDYCTLGLEEAKDRYLNGTLEVDFGAMDNDLAAAYRYVLRTYDKDLASYGTIPNNYYKDLDSISLKRDTFAYFDYCFKSFVDAILIDRYGENFYDEVENKVDSLFQGKNYEEIMEKYYQDFSEDTLNMK